MSLFSVGGNLGFVIGPIMVVPAVAAWGLQGTAIVLIPTIALVVLFMALSALAQSPSVALGQKYLPNHVGLASGVTLGLAISVGGICSPLLGNIGDSYGLTATFYVLSGVTLIAIIGTWFIKEPIEVG